MDVWMYGCMYGWMDGCMDGWMDGRMDLYVYVDPYFWKLPNKAVKFGDLGLGL